MGAAELHPVVIDDLEQLAVRFPFGQFSLVGINFPFDFRDGMPVKVDDLTIDGSLLFQKAIRPAFTLSHAATSRHTITRTFKHIFPDLCKLLIELQP